jgi:hypothetical protein
MKFAFASQDANGIRGIEGRSRRAPDQTRGIEAHPGPSSMRQRLDTVKFREFSSQSAATCFPLPFSGFRRLSPVLAHLLSGHIEAPGYDAGGRGFESRRSRHPLRMKRLGSIERQGAAA